MKKNKSLEEKSINRELFKNILINILVFLTFIVIIGLVVSILINYLFTANTKDTLKRTADKVSTSLVLETAGGNTYYYLSGLENLLVMIVISFSMKMKILLLLPLLTTF